MGLLFVARGNLDEHGVRQLRDVYDELANADQDIAIDMNEVKIIDGSGLGALVYLFKRLCAGGHTLRLTKVHGDALATLVRLGVAQILIGKDTRAERDYAVFDPRGVLDILSVRKAAFKESALSADRQYGEGGRVVTISARDVVADAGDGTRVAAS